MSQWHDHVTLIGILLTALAEPTGKELTKSVTTTAEDEQWDRVWNHHPPDAKDDALLDRERRGPRWACIVEKIVKSFGSIHGLRTIELGSGRGDLSALLAERGAQVTLLDSSEKALAQARYRFERLGIGARFIRDDFFNKSGSWRRSFDVALSSGVIEHFRGEDRTKVVRVHHDTLSSNGMAIISVPHAWCLPYRAWKSYLERRGWWPYGMELPYTRHELIRRMRLVGFERTEGRCMGWWQSIGDHCVKMWSRRRPDWSRRRSMLDGIMGLTLLAFGSRGDESDCTLSRPSLRQTQAS